MIVPIEAFIFFAIGIVILLGFCWDLRQTAMGAKRNEGIVLEHYRALLESKQALQTKYNALRKKPRKVRK